jgi:hypothetical protein
VSDVWWTPRLFVWLAVLMITEGIQAKGEGENPSYLTGVQRETPRFVAWRFE